MILSRSVHTVIISIALIFVVSGIQTSLTVNAQQGNVSQQQIPPTNFSSSIPLANSLLDVLKSKIKVSLLDAMSNVTKSLPNATLLSGSIQPEMGFLVYKVTTLDGNNTIHILDIDPGNGTIISQQQMPAVMSQILPPPIAPQLDNVPSLGVP